MNKSVENTGKDIIYYIYNKQEDPPGTSRARAVAKTIAIIVLYLLTAMPILMIILI